MTGALGTVREIKALPPAVGDGPSDDRMPRGDDRTSVALAATLLGQGTVADLRACGVDCDLGDLARAAGAMPELSIVLTPEGFRCDLPSTALAEALPRLADGWSELVLKTVEVLAGRGAYGRVGTLLAEVIDVIDATPIVFRHAFDLLNVGEVELVESLVFDDAFEAPEWLRLALSGVEGLLWAGLRGYSQQAMRAREIGTFLLDRAAVTDQANEDLVPLAQAWSLLDLYGTWGERVPAAAELPTDLTDGADDLLRCLWTLRRSRQLMALGNLEGALRLLEAADGLVEADSIVGAHLTLDRFVCRALLGEPLGEDAERRVLAASRFVDGLHLELLTLVIDGYAAAALTFRNEGPKRREVERLWERSELHPDPILHAALAIGCAVGAYRRHAFYAALTYVRGLSATIAYLGSTDLQCCAYILEALCLAAMDEEPGPLTQPAVDRPSELGLLPLARVVYGAIQEVLDVAREIDPKGSSDLLDDIRPSYVARTLALIAIGGSWSEARALKDLLPASWLPVDSPDPSVIEALGGASTASDGTLRLVSGSGPVPVLPRLSLTHLGAPKLTICMLGHFDVFVGACRITDESWRRKASKLILQLLAVTPGHTLSRAGLCELIWPDRDFLASRNHLYSVLSATRSSLGCVDGEPPYLLCEQGKVSLNSKLTECDVDVFERHCHEVLSHEGDIPWRLSLCRQLSRTYDGGLYVPAQDVRGDFTARQRGIEALYVDTLVEATDLSLKAGLAKEALWFSRDALDHDELREDVAACHFRALAADGRAKELEMAYGRYCQRLSEGLYLAPPARIRTLYEDLVAYAREAAVPRDDTLLAFEQALGDVA